MIRRLKKATLLLLVVFGLFAFFFLRRSSNRISREYIVRNVDIESFCGDWYVVANIPTIFEKGAHNAVETYSLRDDGNLDIEFSFRKDSVDGEKKKITGRLIIRYDDPVAEWKVQFFWPIRFTYLVLNLAPDYRYTVIGVPNRKYVWIMSRTPSIDQFDMRTILDRLQVIGYDTRKIREVPQNWDNKEI